MSRKILIPAFAVLVTIPLVINLVGWNLFWYTDLGEKDLILGSSVGVAHFAFSDSFGDPRTEEEKNFEYDYFDYSDISETILEVGPIHIFAEKRFDPMRFLGFGTTNDTEPFEYKAFEFPWLLFTLLPLVGLIKRKQNQSSHTTSASAPR